MEFELENPLTSFCNHHQDDHQHLHSSLFLVESQHMPSLSSYAVSFRQKTVSSISQASSRFDPFLSYLAVNYLDRFLSTREFPQEKPWVINLLAVSCISLAVKMMNRTSTDLSLNDIQENVNNGGGGMIFDAQTVQRMETIILGALKWRMRSVTPFSFIPFFTNYFSKLKDPPPLKQALRARAVEIILRAQNEVKLIGFKPSVIAASGLLSSCHELFPLQFSCFRDSILSCSYVNKEMVGECYKEMQEMAKEEYESVMDRASSSYSDTAVNVLDRQFLSSSSWSDSEDDAEEEVKKGTIDVSGSGSCSFSRSTSANVPSTNTTGEVVQRSSDETDQAGEIMVMMINGSKDAKRRKINTDYYCN